MLTIHYLYELLKSKSKQKFLLGQIYLKGVFSGMFSVKPYTYNRTEGRAVKKRICIIAKYFPSSYGGVESVIYGIIKTAIDSRINDIEMTVIYRSNSNYSGDKINNCHYIPIVDIKIPLIGDVLYSFLAGAKCLSSKYDVVHTHGEVGFG